MKRPAPAASARNGAKVSKKFKSSSSSSAGKKRPAAAAGSAKNGATGPKKFKTSAPKPAPEPAEERKTGKELKQMRKMHKPHGDMVEQAKKLWEDIRTHNTASAKRTELVTQLFNLIKGQLHDVIFRHDAARVVQCLIQFGNASQRQEVFNELNVHWMELMKSTYGKFVVTKMLDYGTKEQKAQTIAAMYGSVRKLIKHQDASTILEVAFRDYANASQRNALVREFYSPEFAVFKNQEATSSFEELCNAHPDKRESYIKFLGESILGSVTKGTVTHSIVHRVLREYMEVADQGQKHEMASALVEHVVSILHTRDGSLAAIYVLWNAGAKERKQIIKSFKGHVAKIAREEYGHHVLLALMDCMDDTVLIRKAVFNELLEDLAELCADKFARLVLLYILSPRSGRYLHPAHIATLQKGDSNTYSKKDRDVRMRELLEGMSGPLVETVKENSEWILEGKTAQVVEEVLLQAKASDDKRQQAIETVLKVETEEGLLSHPVAGLVLKRLILADATINGLRLGQIVWERLCDSAPEAIESVQGCYTLGALLHADQPEELRKSVATALAKLPLGDADAQGENGKPTPKAVLAKAVFGVVGTGKKAPASAAK